MVMVSFVSGALCTSFSCSVSTVCGRVYSVRVRVRVRVRVMVRVRVRVRVMDRVRFTD
jgi:hypothetical protein